MGKYDEDYNGWTDYLEDKADEEGYDSVSDMIEDYIDNDKDIEDGFYD